MSAGTGKIGLSWIGVVSCDMSGTASLTVQNREGVGCRDSFCRSLCLARCSGAGRGAVGQVGVTENERRKEARSVKKRASGVLGSIECE